MAPDVRDHVIRGLFELCDEHFEILAQLRRQRGGPGGARRRFWQGGRPGCRVLHDGLELLLRGHFVLLVERLERARVAERDLHVASHSEQSLPKDRERRVQACWSITLPPTQRNVKCDMNGPCG